MGMDDIFGGFAQGAGTGAGIGLMIPGAGPMSPLIGGAIGGLAGGLAGGLSGSRRDKAKGQYNQQMDAALAQLSMARQQAYQQRMGDLDQIMSFYGPALQEAQRLTGRDFTPPKFAGQQFGGAAPAAQAPAPGRLQQWAGR